MRELREVVPGDYTGTLVTDRFSSYEAEELAGVEPHKCLSHLIRNVGGSGLIHLFSSA